jgi:hypothetical protein
MHAAGSFMTDPRPARFPSAVLAALVVFLPLAHLSGLADPFALPRSILLTLAALLLLLDAAWRASRGTAPAWAPRRFALPAAGLLAAAALATFLSFNRGLAVRGLVDLACLAVIGWAASGVGRDPRATRRLMHGALFSATLVAAGVLAQVFVPGFQIALGPLSILPRRPPGTFSDQDWRAVAPAGAAAGAGRRDHCRGPAHLLSACGLGDRRRVDFRRRPRD